MKSSRQAAPVALVALVAIALAATACQKKEPPPEAGQPAAADTAQQAPAPEAAQPSADSAASDSLSGTASALFDSVGQAVDLDINADGIMDTVRAAHVASPAGIQAAYSVVVPEKANGADAGKLSGWGLALTLGAADGKPHKADSVFFPTIPAVIYDQGAPVALSTAASEDEFIRDLGGKDVRQVLALFTESGTDIFLYFADGKFSLYWPGDEG